MSLSIGIIGLPNVGKSTLFNALTNAHALAANYPFATIEPNTGIVPVPDARLETLSNLYNHAPIKPATVECVDIAGLVEGASKGEGLGNQFLANIRECSAIVHVVRAFTDNDIIRHNAHDSTPQHDIEIITTELILADLQTLDKHIPKLEKEAKARPSLQPYLADIRTIRTTLDSGAIPSPLTCTLQTESWTTCRQELQLLTLKPVIYAFNVDEATLTNTDRQAELAHIVAPSESLYICAKLEEELCELNERERQELLESYGVHTSGLVQLVTAAYRALGLQSYLTAGDKEVRAWTIKQGATAPEAAGVIHSDFEKGFIAAIVVNYDDLIVAGSEQAARSAGKVHTVGRDYTMQPNDVVEFRFNKTV